MRKHGTSNTPSNISSKLCVNQLRLSYKGRTEDALAPSADEGRGKHRYASGSRKQAVIRGFPNGATQHS
jgi:hypothetical protein